MGRRKIEIVRIENERHRQVTFTKRKGGLIKKATELAILCDAEVAVVIFGANQKLTMYSSGNVDEIITKYSQHKADPHNEIITTEDYFRDRARKGGAVDSDDDGGGGMAALAHTAQHGGGAHPQLLFGGGGSSGGPPPQHRAGAAAARARRPGSRRRRRGRSRGTRASPGSR